VKITKALNAGVVELAFFRCRLTNDKDVDGLVAALKELAPVAQDAA
jgi:hypothetical protein